MKLFFAKLNLLKHLILHFLKKPFLKRSGLKKFYENYAVDGIFPISSGEREVLQASAACINCGLCVQELQDVKPKYFNHYHSPAMLALAVSRALPYQWTNEEGAVGVVNFTNAQKHCPRNVPLTEIPKVLSSISEHRVTL